MDFRQTNQSNSGRPATPTVTPPVSEHKIEKELPQKKKSAGKWMRLANAVILIGVAVLIAGIALAFTQGNTRSESKYVEKAKYQAVFLSNGQVYFGNIDSLNDNYVHLTNIYYLTQTGDSTSSNYSLVKLGCQQIHDPADEMVINRSQVTFWENLNNDGKVVSSIKQYQNQIKNESQDQICAQVSNQTQASNSSSTTQGAANTTGTGSSTTGTGTGTTPTK